MNAPNEPRDVVHAEARLRDAIAAYTDTVEPSPDAWHRLRDATASGARRRFAGPVFALAGAAAVAAAIALVVLVGRDTKPGGVKIPPTDTTVEPSPDTTTPDSTPATTAPHPTPGGIDGIVAASPDGRVLLLDLEGNEVRTIVDAVDGEQVFEVAYDAPHGRVWYLAKPAGQRYGCGELRNVPIGGGDYEAEANALHFALSADASKVALAFDNGGDARCANAGGRNVIVVRDAESGDEIVRWDLEQEPAWVPMVTSLAFSPDGSKLAASLCYEGCEARWFVLEGGGVISGGGFMPGDISLVAWSSDRLVGHEYCCFPEYNEKSTLTEYDTTTGERVAELVDYANTPFVGLVGDPRADRFLVLIAENSLDIWIPGSTGPSVSVPDVMAAAWAPGLVPVEPAGD